MKRCVSLILSCRTKPAKSAGEAAAHGGMQLNANKGCVGPTGQFATKDPVQITLLADNGIPRGLLRTRDEKAMVLELRLHRGDGHTIGAEVTRCCRASR